MFFYYYSHCSKKGDIPAGGPIKETSSSTVLLKVLRLFGAACSDWIHSSNVCTAAAKSSWRGKHVYRVALALPIMMNCDFICESAARFFQDEMMCQVGGKKKKNKIKTPGWNECLEGIFLKGGDGLNLSLATNLEMDALHQKRAFEAGSISPSW